MYKTYIGLEVHIQSKTKSKMFCSCSSGYFGADPNTQVCPVCLGLPGALPVINRKAIENCIKLCLAVNCEINQHTKFDRKHYFYADLPKGYQISQYDLPIGKNGFIEVSGGETQDDKTRIRVKRIHQEEDTAKSLHTSSGTAIDCNKSGVALIEVVTEPDFDNTTQVTEFAKKLQQIVRYLDVSDANMEMGQMRFELNISVGRVGEGLPPYKVECKNISSISVLEKVILFEEKRQQEVLESGAYPIQETRGIDDVTGETFSQRIKEDAEDYRYFPEPDLPWINISDNELEEIKQSLPELPDYKIEMFQRVLGLPFEQAEILVADIDKCRFFEEVIHEHLSDQNFVRQVANFIIGEIPALFKKYSQDFSTTELKSDTLADIISALIANKISGSTVKKLLDIYIQGENMSVNEYIDKNDLIQISDENVILPEILATLAANQKIVDEYKSGKTSVKAALVGQIMGKFKGKANPQVIDKLLEIELKK